MSKKISIITKPIVSIISVNDKKRRKRNNQFDIVYKWHDPLDVISLKVSLK